VGWGLPLAFSFKSSNSSQEPLAEDLTAAMWRLKRIDRRQEELAIEQAKALFEAGADADFGAARIFAGVKVGIGQLPSNRANFQPAAQNRSAEAL